MLGADEVRTEDLGPRYNVAPTDPLYALAVHRGRRLLGSFRWGLVAPGAPDPNRGPRPINARVESLLTKPLFRDALTWRRCVLPVDGFYEWTTTSVGTKQPWFLCSPDGDSLVFAGLWARWRDGDDELRTCTIVTRPAEGAVARLHDRMPVSLPCEAWDEWLDPANHESEGLAEVVRTVVVQPVTARRVGMRVNNVRNDGPELLRTPD